MTGKKPAESIEKKESKKPAKAKKKPTSAESAKLLAEKIRSEKDRNRSIQPGTVVNGDTENWVYYHIADGLVSTDQQVAYVERVGYVPCTDGEKMIGLNGGRLFKLPKEIADQRAQEKRARRNR